MKMWTRLRIEGLNIDRQFDKMIKSGVVAKNIVRVDRKTIEFSLPCSQKDKGIAFFGGECYNVLTIDNAPLVSFFHFVKKRFVFALCIVVMAAALFWQGGYIWRVEIDYDGDKTVVEQVLKQNGIWIGTSKNAISLDGAENILCNNMPQVNYAIVSVKGSTLFVDIYDKTVPQDIVDLATPKNIYAEADGIVSRIVVVSGTARVAVGDKVSKGQLLIEGVRAFADETSQPVCAVGEVYATVSSKGYAQFDGYTTSLAKTGKSKTLFGLKLFGFEVSPDTNVYDKQIVESVAGKFFPLPVQITTTTVYEAQENKQKVDFDEQTYRQMALANALEGMQGQYTDVIYTQTPDGEGILVTAEVFAQKRIDTY